MPTMSEQLRLLFPLNPGFTEAHVPDQRGKVFIVTGSSGGIGKHLAGMLYGNNATVYIAARSQIKSEAAVAHIRKLHPSSAGRLEYLHLDLADLTTIKRSADDFLARERRLDVLWNNAGVMAPPQGSVTAQGYELQQGTNNLGPFLFTKLLYPLLVATATAGLELSGGGDNSQESASVRVVWVSSNGAQLAPRPAIDFDNIDYRIRDEGAFDKYYRSKAGNVFHAIEMARRSRAAGDGVISVAVDPGLIKTDLARTLPLALRLIFKPFTGPPEYGACSELFAGLHPSITQERNGAWIAPYGRINTQNLRQDLLDSETAKRFWEWTEEQVRPYL